VPTPDLSRRLRIGPGDHVLMLNPPPGYLDLLAPLPEGASAGESRGGLNDQVQLFVAERAQLERDLGGALESLKPGGVLWAAYPNPDSGTITDLSRDHGWGSLQVAGLVAVAHIAVDSSWNAHGFQRSTEVDGTRINAVPAADMLPVGRHATLTFRIVRRVSIWLFHVLFRFKVSGLENVPHTAFVVIANHLGWMDAISLLLMLPAEPRVHFLADPGSMMRNRPLWALVHATGGIVPVDRTKHADPTLFRHVHRCLELGGAIALFPEGDFGPREGELLPFKKGFAHFAVDAQAPVLPVALSGMKEIWLRKELEVRIGEPIPTTVRTPDEVMQISLETMRRLLPAYMEPTGPKPLRRWLTSLF
jgi:1-acyl-sn-glycerol-3-phosphate acyltransferase